MRRKYGLGLTSLVVVIVALFTSSVTATADTSIPNFYVEVTAATEGFGPAPIFEYTPIYGGLPPGATLSGAAECDDVYDSGTYGPTESSYPGPPSYVGLAPGNYTFVQGSCHTDNGNPLTLQGVGGTYNIVVVAGGMTISKAQTSIEGLGQQGTDVGGVPTKTTLTTVIADDANEGQFLDGATVTFSFQTAGGPIEANVCAAKTVDDGMGDYAATCSLTTKQSAELYDGTGVWTATYAGNAYYAGTSFNGQLVGLTTEAAAQAHLHSILNNPSTGDVVIVPVNVPPNCYNPYVGSDLDLLSVSLGELTCSQMQILQITTSVVLGIALVVGGDAEVLSELASVAVYEGTVNLPAVDLPWILTRAAEFIPASNANSGGGNIARTHGRATSSSATDRATRTVMTPSSLAVSRSGDVYISDFAQHVIDKVTPSGKLSVVAGIRGNGGKVTIGRATRSKLANPDGVAVSSSGNLYIADSGTDQTVEKVAANSKQLSIVAGIRGTRGALKAGRAKASHLSDPTGLAVDSKGNVYVADTLHGVVEKITPSGKLSVIAGIPGAVGASVPGPATKTPLYLPTAVAVDAAGDVYIADSGSHVVEKVTPKGVLSIVAGNGSRGAPTAGAADASDLGDPTGVAIDKAGDLYIADPGNQVVEKVTPGGTLSIAAGTGKRGRPAAGPATGSRLDGPGEVAVDRSGDLYIADTGNNLVERVSHGKLKVFAGTGRTTAMTTIQLKADAAVSQQLQSVESLMQAVNYGKLMTSAHRATALHILQTDLNGLLRLGNKIPRDTKTQRARADYNKIASTYRVSALALPQVRLADAADDLSVVQAPKLTSAYDQLEALLQGADSGQDTPAIEAKMSDLRAQITTMTTLTSKLASAVLAYTPAKWATDKALIASAAGKITNAQKAEATASSDSDTVAQDLGATLTASAG